jgi:hypothetical protein
MELVEHVLGTRTYLLIGRARTAAGRQQAGHRAEVAKLIIIHVFAGFEPFDFCVGRCQTMTGIDPLAYGVALVRAGCDDELPLAVIVTKHFYPLYPAVMDRHRSEIPLQIGLVLTVQLRIGLQFAVFLDADLADDLCWIGLVV